MPRVLFVHGVSHVEVADPDWVNEWLGVVAPEMPGTNVAAMTEFQPDVVCAHSLGSLIC